MIQSVARVVFVLMGNVADKNCHKARANAFGNFTG